jgi:serine/threonine-protein kinase ULK2
MPKIVDNYVLERKIGTGQFGEVFKGYNKVTNQDIAVKVIKRENLKGKFTELLENEIKVLRTCDNENIIKLYDIKKTANNIYLVLEYCNEGDLMEYLKKKKNLTEEEAVEYLIQILNAFKTLNKAKIMHRDFKLPNILKHNGNIKIADFGFAKLLPADSNWATTMLGSPLNMAPEVLNGTEYNNKADIWSIGTCFFELLFGKPPYTAGNMVDLLKNIKTKPLEIPRRINNISPTCEDVLRKMLTVDWKKRIEWEELYKHEINFYLEEKIKKDLEQTLKSQDMNLSLNMSRFYIKNNMVIDHPAEINKKEELNNFAFEVTKNKNANEYKGAIMKRQTVRGAENVEKDSSKEDVSPSKGSADKNVDLNELAKEETEREITIRTNKKNANRILHERNIYVFLASVAEDAMGNGTNPYSEILGFLLVKKLLSLIDNLKTQLAVRANLFKLIGWDKFIISKDFNDIFAYISKEYDIFKVYFDQLYEKMALAIREAPKNKFDPDFVSAVNDNLKQNNEKTLMKVLALYSKDLIKELIGNKYKSDVEARNMWVHADRILDCMALDVVFSFEDEKGNQFNFKMYYDEGNRCELEAVIKRVEQKMVAFKI